jgi:DNA-binding CsgD family transcriptional regulator
MTAVADHIPGAALPREIFEGAGNGLALVMDELAHGVLLASAKGQLLHANQVARDELARRRVLSVSEGLLYTSDATQSRVLTEALGRAEIGRRSLIALRAADRRRVSIAVVPLHPERPHAAGPIALVLSRPAVCEALMLCFFARTHGLTHSEEQVLAILAQGYSAPQVAAQLKVAVSTVRSHVRAMCTKTHANGVRALVSQLAVLPPLSAARPQEPLH